ncbi:Concanavalin A-like lectin/glucanases superfamily [uncultured Caudovirales phage]|uniref:Concanavalin A-like lectin/glucanases superfamily n=1 Tax=uncultured Caudovirales phage TaxID=2100421 RepID=A0A6J7WDU6_9CAUD|nr:Concanavalin A-like lectin/glucanases superfamily [uncultured Caudovirales phage]
MANINTYGNKILQYNGRFFASTPLLLQNIYSAYNVDGNVNDSLGLKNGTFVGTATYSAGVIGQAINLNGSSYVALPTNTHNLTGNFTLSLWINLTAFSSSSKLASTYTNTGVQNGWTFAITASGGITFNAWNAGTSVSTLTAVNGSISSATWTHLVLVYNSGSGTSLYKNGTLLASGTATTGISYYTTFYPTIGANKYTASLVDGYISGKMDGIFFWDRAFNIDEVAILYKNGSGNQYPF